MLTSNRRSLVQMANYGLFAGTVTWMVLCVRGAQVLKQGGVEAYNTMFGPLFLMQMRKQPRGDGFTVGFTLESGIIAYAAFWLMVGLGLGVGLLWYVRKMD